MLGDPPIEPPGCSEFDLYEHRMESMGWVRWNKVLESWNYYWWWNEDPDGEPAPVHVMHSRTDDAYFANAGQHGWNRAQKVKEMGGWWMKMNPPARDKHPDR